MAPKQLGRRGTLATLAGAALSARAAAQEPAKPQVASPPMPQTTAPASPTAAPASPAAHPAAPAIDKTKTYYLFFDQAIDTVTMRTLRRQLATLVEAGVTHITLVIDSPGGQIDPMLVTYSFIRALPAVIETHGQGFVQSAATVLFLAGERRSADRTTRFLFHPTTTPIVGTMNEQQMQERVTQVDTVQSVIAEIYRDRTRLTDDAIRGFAHSEVIWTAAQARDAGILDEVSDLKIPGADSARILFLD